MLQDEDDEFVLGSRLDRIRVVERLGPTLENLLCKGSPWKFRGCSRIDCFPCQHGEGAWGDCESESVNYTISCLECKKKGKDVEYLGESARTMYDRGAEHLNDLLTQAKGKPLWEHVREDHDGEIQTSWFRMKLVKKSRSALQRQIREALEIEGSGAEVVLNRKGEWNGSRIPRIRVEVGDRIDEGETKLRSDKDEEKKYLRMIRDNFKKSCSEKRKVASDSDTEMKGAKKMKLERQLLETSPTVSTDNNPLITYEFVDLDKACKEAEAEEEAATTTEDIEAKEAQATENIREVVSLNETVYFVCPLDDKEEELWPENDVLVEVAKEEDLKTRLEEVMKTNLVFWARDILLQAVSQKIQERTNVRNWSKKILQDLIKQVPQVVRMKMITCKIVDDVGDCVKPEVKDEEG